MTERNILVLNKLTDTTGRVEVAQSGDTYGIPRAISSDIPMAEKADHSSTPAAGYGYLWVKNTSPNTLIFTDDAGTDWLINQAAGSYLTAADIDTLAELNAIVGDATLIDTNDSRLSDARTPTAHTHTESDITDLGSYLTSTIDGVITRTYDEGEGTKIGADFGWKDILGPIEVRGVGVNSPAWSQIGSTAFYDYKFAIGKECWVNFHVPHDYVPGTDVYFHVHWIADGTNTANVKWEFTIAHGRGFAQDVFNVAAPVTAYAEEAAAGVAYTHMVTETTGVTLTNLEVDSFIKVRLRRVTNGGTDNTDGIFVITTDIHYQSTGLPTKNKAPDFYV